MKYFLSLESPDARTLAIAMQAIPGMGMKHDRRARHDLWACLLADTGNASEAPMRFSARSIALSTGAGFDPDTDLLCNQLAPHVIFHPQDGMTVQVAHVRDPVTAAASHTGVFLVTIEYSADNPKAANVFGMVLANIVFRAKKPKLKVFSFDPPAPMTARRALHRYATMITP